MGGGMKTVILFAIGVVFPIHAVAVWNPADEDLDNCKWRNGWPMSEKQCAEFREEVAQEDLKPTKQMDDERAALNKQREEDWIKLNQAEQARKEQEKEHSKQIEHEWAENHAREEAENKHAREQQERKEAKEETALKRKCGKNYHTLRIGMTLDNLEQCVGAIYITKTVSKGGVIETYRTSFDWVHVQNGRVISYTERTDN